MSKFGWSYPAGAANDPMAPYNQDVVPEDDSDTAHGCGPACPGCWWCLPALPDADDTREAGPPKAVFLCVCGHSEEVHSIEHLEELSEGFVEHWECRLCPCQDFEVGS